ncbi:hypothetical protein ACYOEI_31745 [Singulisphaera rosea]
MDYDDAYETLIAVGRKYGFRPDIPLEAEDFFRDLVSLYSGSIGGLAAWLEDQVIEFYRSLVNPPKWLQDPEWPFFGGKPMQFVGQVDLPEGSTLLLRHNASYYVFLDYNTGSTKVIVQAD